MEHDCESIQVSNVQWAEVMVESVVQQLVINGEIIRSGSFLASIYRSRTIVSSGRPLAW